MNRHTTIVCTVTDRMGRSAWGEGSTRSRAESRARRYYLEGWGDHLRPSRTRSVEFETRTQFLAPKAPHGHYVARAASCWALMVAVGLALAVTL